MVVVVVLVGFVDADQRCEVGGRGPEVGVPVDTDQRRGLVDADQEFSFFFNYQWLGWWRRTDGRTLERCRLMDADQR